jgi:hypothetical protein
MDNQVVRSVLQENIKTNWDNLLQLHVKDVPLVSTAVLVHQLVLLCTKSERLDFVDIEGNLLLPGALDV